MGAQIALWIGPGTGTGTCPYGNRLGKCWGFIAFWHLFPWVKYLNAAIQTVLENTQPLAYSRGERLPLYVWALNGVGVEDGGEVEGVLRELDRRGIALFATWDHRKEVDSLNEGLQIAQAQQKLGLRVSVNANQLLHRIFNGDLSTAHVGEDGAPFFDFSFSDTVSMGCPFAVRHRFGEIRDRVETFAKAYRDAGVEIDVAFADWEIDGPIEWNAAWDHSKRCVRCRKAIGEIESFEVFQGALRDIRAEIQREVYAGVLKRYFPNVLVGNYAEYPHNGDRYWYDYFEQLPEGAPFRADGSAKYRPWAQTFAQTGYTFAMPVVYTWCSTFGWYDFENLDYRWFYNMLLVGSNAAKSKGVPIGTFVHWHTTAPPERLDPSVVQFSEEKYQALLWHLFLRGHDALFLWCRSPELAKEVRLVHEVYAQAQQYGDFLDRGEPVTFDVPATEGAVVSALRVEDSLLVLRTDFTDNTEPVVLDVNGKPISIPQSDDCQILSLP